MMNMGVDLFPQTTIQDNPIVNEEGTPPGVTMTNDSTLKVSV